MSSYAFVPSIPVRRKLEIEGEKRCRSCTKSQTITISRKRYRITSFPFLYFPVPHHFALLYPSISIESRMHGVLASDIRCDVQLVLAPPWNVERRRGDFRTSCTPKTWDGLVFCTAGGLVFTMFLILSLARVRNPPGQPTL